MVTLSDRYGDLDIEDLVDDEVEFLDPEDGVSKEIDLSGAIFQKGEVRSFDEDFGNVLDETLAEMEAIEPEWSDEFIAEIDAQEYFERTIEREED